MAVNIFFSNPSLAGHFDPTIGVNGMSKNIFFDF